MFKVLKININNQLNFSRIVEVVVSLLVSILFGSFGENPYYVVQLLPTKSNESLGLSTVFIPLAMRVISCLSELIFRAYLHFSDPHANSSVFITTSSILFLTFSHLISFFTGIAILIFKLPFDKGIVSMGIFLIMKSFFFPFFRMGLFWYGAVLTRGCFGMGLFRMGLFWFGAVLTWGCFGLGMFWFGAV